MAKKDPNIKYGRCNNIGNCPKANSKEIIEVPLGEDFVCPNPDCGSTLSEVTGGDGGGKKKLFIALAIVLVLGGGIGLYFTVIKDKEPTEVNVPASGGTETETEVTETETDKTDPTKVTPANQQPVNNGISIGWASYKGETYGGKPDGKGILTVTKSYSIDLKDGNKLSVNLGDKIHDAYFEEGRLVRGELHRKNGERSVFHIGK